MLFSPILFILSQKIELFAGRRPVWPWRERFLNLIFLIRNQLLAEEFVHFPA